MTTLFHRRRRVAGTVYYDAEPHARHFRACNADHFHRADEHLAVARAVFNALLCIGAVGALLALGAVAVLMMAGPA